MPRETASRGLDPAFHIRPATPADIPALRTLIHASVLGLAHPEYSPAEIEGALGYALGLDAQLVEDQTYFVAETPEGTLAGCGGWSYRSKLCGSDELPNGGCAPLNHNLDPSTEAAKIRAIYVHPDYARRGLGTLILKHCEDAAAAAGFRHFEMGSTLTGVPLYTLKGYQPRERVDIPLPNGTILGVLHMVKTVASR